MCSCVRDICSSIQCTFLSIRLPAWNKNAPFSNTRQFLLLRLLIYAWRIQKAHYRLFRLSNVHLKPIPLFHLRSQVQEQSGTRCTCQCCWTPRSLSLRDHLHNHPLPRCWHYLQFVSTHFYQNNFFSYSPKRFFSCQLPFVWKLECQPYRLAASQLTTQAFPLLEVSGWGWPIRSGISFSYS